MGRLTAERLRELEQAGADRMVVMDQAGPGRASHGLLSLERDPAGEWTARLVSRRTGEVYLVGLGYCTCPHHRFHVQRAGPAARCKHSAWLAGYLERLGLAPSGREAR